MTPGAHILRLRDAIHPEDANTPVRSVCYALQLILSGDAAPDDVDLQILRQIEELSQVFTDPDSRKRLALATQALVSKQHYKSLKSLRALMPREERLLAAARNRSN